MSEIMQAVLRMPPELFWTESPIIREQHDHRRFQAADEIDRLRAEVERLRAVQEPVGRVVTVGGYPDESEHIVEWLCKYKDLKAGDLLYTVPQSAVQGESVACEVVGRTYRESFGCGVRLKLYVDAHQWPITEAIPIGTKLYFQPQPAEQQPGSDVSALVEALEDIGHSCYSISTELEKYMRNIARYTLAVHRKAVGDQP